MSSPDIQVLTPRKSLEEGCHSTQSIVEESQPQRYVANVTNVTQETPSTPASKRSAAEDVSDKPSSAKKFKMDPAEPPSEKRLRKFRPKAPQTFHDVYDRALKQRFYVLKRTRCGTDDCPEEIVELTGSTGNVYTIHIAREPKCNCPHARKGNQCKHVLYVMSKLLKAPYQSVYQLALLSSELRDIFAAAPPISAPSVEKSKKRKPIEGDCPICYCALRGKSNEAVVWCRAACGQNMHQQCFQMWARTKQGDVTCPMCRSVWETGKDAASMVRKEDGDMEEGHIDLFGMVWAISWQPVEIWPKVTSLKKPECTKMTTIPATMRSLIAPKKCNPIDYEVTDMPTPKITAPDQVLLRMRAAAINTGDTQFATGVGGFIVKLEFPMKLGIEGAGVVVAVGSGVTKVKVGDEVYGFGMDKPVPDYPEAGWASEYAIAVERFLLHKPAHVSFEEAASFTSLVVTALQTIQRGLQLSGEKSLEGKTVFVPGALSASGSVALQVARNVFGATKIISTVSTPKMPLVEQYLPGMVDQLIDYTKEDVRKAVGKGTVDLSFNTQWTTFDDSLALLKPDSGVLMSIASIPSKKTTREVFGDRMPVWLGWLVSLVALYYSWKLRGTAIKYEFVSGSPNIRADLEAAGEAIAREKVKAVMTVVDLENVEEVRKGCEKVKTGKGGLGKLVIRVAKE
ncbi:hypothetical protein BGZ63DRAFT_419252 [Mariannaea sp. PMI_226]|nr:hypothetical protein BGZ63DRAFT_419252 [Mariannaea sp. PMI_226]